MDCVVALWCCDDEPKANLEASNPDIMYPSNPSQVAARHAAQSLPEI